MAVDQPGQDAPALEVDDPGLRTRERQYFLVGADGQEAAVADGDGARGRLASCKRSELAVMQDQISGCCWFGHVRARVRSRSWLARPARYVRAGGRRWAACTAPGATRRRDASPPPCASPPE